MPKFTPRERKHKRARQELSSHIDNSPANAEIIIPQDKHENEERRKRLQAQLKAQQPHDNLNSKKRKRLDKYIDAKLKKEETLELLKKLAGQKVDTSLLQSAKKLGRVHESKRERFSRALKEREAGLDVDGQQDSILFESRTVADPVDSSDHEESNAVDGANGTPVEITHATIIQPNSLPFGSGLKRPLETDDTGNPLIKRRKRRKVAKKLSQEPIIHQAHDDLSIISDDDELTSANESSGDDTASEDSEWSGFESEDQDKDSVLDLSQDAEDSEGRLEPSTESDDEENAPDKPARVSAFKAWADSQRNQALGFIPSAAPMSDEHAKATFVPRAPSPDPVASDIISTMKSESMYRPSASMVIPRSEEVQAARLDLPVVQDEQKIMEAIHNNPVTVVCGATGSGKTTQLPQMLLENGYASTGMIGITQPRRVAATSVANRVAHELGPTYGKQVAHQVRYDSNVGRGTKIKFMTDGILLREINQDFALSRYSAIIIDEAHERSVNTDILIGMLSRIVPLRFQLSQEQSERYHPLKLIIMSATLRVADFILNERLFRGKKPPIVEAEGRQYKVTEHFARRTKRDYVAETVSKVSRGHKKLPPGSMLVFLTGQDEIQTVIRQLKEAFASEATGFLNSKRPFVENLQKVYMEESEADDSGSEAEITGLDDDDDDAEFEVEVEPNSLQQRGGMKAHILPLYAALPAHQQMKVFQPPPEGSRAIILATNVAETSLTIPGVKYVFDCGRSKEKRYDTATGVQEFRVDWISKASASQRMGRAGRTGPGHCYRLYSSAIYEQYFEDHSLPEILRVPIEGTVLQLKNIDVDNVVNFPFPTPPQGEQLAQAENLLRNLGAVDARTRKVTALGTKLIHYPVNPRFAKMLLLGKENKVLTNTIALVAGLAVGELFLPEVQLRTPGDDKTSSGNETGQVRQFHHEDTAIQKLRQSFGRARAVLSSWDESSDALKVLTAVALHAQAEVQGNAEVLGAVAAHSQLEIQDGQSLCNVLFLQEKNMAEVQSLRRQLHNNAQRQGHDIPFKPVLEPPTQGEVSMLKQIVACGYLDQVAIRADLLPSATLGRRPRRAIEVAYRTLLSSVPDGEIDRSATLEEQQQQKNVYVHSSSVLAKLSSHEMPSYVIYSNLSRATAKAVGEKATRIRMHPLTSVGPKQLARLAEGTPLLEFGKPIGKIEDSEGGKKRECWVPISLQNPNPDGSSGWPLGAWKVLQVRKGKEWMVEKVLDRGK